MTYAVELDNVSRSYDDMRAVGGVSIAAKDGEFSPMLGPSGSGKTTCLRLVAGFKQLSGGTISILGRPASNLPPWERDVNTVFQDYALFPHMSILDNVAYELMVKGMNKKQRHAMAQRALGRVALGFIHQRKPSQLSGGQHQRVAVARALVNEPRVLLLNESFGILGFKSREQMQPELKKLQQSLGITLIFVTHDQGGALSMSDRVAVFNNGRIEQVDPLRDLYMHPRTPFVAGFVGTSNVFGGLMAEKLCGMTGSFALRPEHIRLNTPGELQANGTIQAVQYQGVATRFELKLNDGGKLLVSQASMTGEELSATLTPGQQVMVSWSRDVMVSLAEERWMAINVLQSSSRPGLGKVSGFFWRSPGLELFLLSPGPLMWFGIVHFGSLLTLLWQGFYTSDDFIMSVTPELTLMNIHALFNPTNYNIILRTLVIAMTVTIASAILAFPTAWCMAHYTSRKMKAFLYIAVMLPVWASYIVRACTWTLLLAKDGMVQWFLQHLGLEPLLIAFFTLPAVGGNTLSTSGLGCFLMLLYTWLPFMILPVQAALERLSPSLLQASADLSARPRQTFHYMVLPLAIPGIAADSIFTFSLTLGGFIVPQLVGPPGCFVGNMACPQQRAIGNIPAAAAFTLVPIALIALYLAFVKRLGVFDILWVRTVFPQAGGLGRRGFPTFSRPDYRHLYV